MNALPASPAVSAAYQGVWTRTLLETPEGRDTCTWVRWLQTSHWHGDLRVPPGANRHTPEGLALQQGFGGITTITRPNPAQPEVCTWQRRIDFQPPRSTPDAGHMVFETSERVIETGIHGQYLEVWQRLPASLGRRIALARADAHGQPTAERLLLAGQYLMHLRPRSAAWPADQMPDETLADLVQRHPAAAAALLDFEISFGLLDQDLWTVERSTLPALEGVSQPVRLQREAQGLVVVQSQRLPQHWLELDWNDADAPG